MLETWVIRWQFGNGLFAFLPSAEKIDTRLDLAGA